MQLSVLPPEIYSLPTPWKSSLSLADWLRPRILELCYTAEDMRPFAADLDYMGEPFAWDEERRLTLRAELDAAFFHLYLPAQSDGSWRKCANESDAEYASLLSAFPSPRKAVEHILQSFPITREKELKKFGEYKSARLILQNYDVMLKAMKAGAD